MAEYLRLMAAGAVRLDDLPRQTYAIDDAQRAFEEKPLLALLEYPERAAAADRVVRLRSVAAREGAIRVALVGAGGFAQGSHLPNLLKLSDRFELRAVVSRTGATAKAVAARAEAAYATTELDEVLHDDGIDLVLIATRHNLHAEQTLRALRADKHVFVEKPLCLTEPELQEIEALYADRDGPLLMTGFNRRFSPAAVHARKLLAPRTTPLVAQYRMNAGYIPLDHWVHGPEGGGRNIGEACHIYDLFDFLVGSNVDVESVTARAIRADGTRLASSDNFVATVGYADGSVCTLTYTALGNRDHPKEQMEVFADGTVLTLDDYKALRVRGQGSGWRSTTQRKGHLEELEALARAIREGGPWPISLDEQASAMRVAFAVEDQVRG
jgi:predicted dehydrogenase